MKRFHGLQLKSVSVNTFVQLFSRLATSIPTLVATILIGYFSGYETVGSFTKVVSFVSIFYLVIDFGINSIFLKNYFEDTKKYMGNLVVLRLLLAAILIPLIALIAFFLPHTIATGTGFSNPEKYGIVVFALTILTVGINTSLQAYLQRRLNYQLSVVPNLLSSIVLLCFVVIAAMTGNLPLLFLSYVISGIVLATSLYFVLRGAYKIRLQLTDFNNFSKKLIVASIPFGTMLFLNLLYAKADTIILSLYRPTYDVGVYGIAYKFFELSLALPAYLANSVYPLLLSENEDKKAYIPLFKRYSSFFLFASLVATVMVFFFAPFITVFKSEFSKSILPLQILSLSLPFFFLTSLLQWHFIIRNKLKFLVPLYGFSLLLNVVLNLIFIPVYSYTAAAIITGICEGLVFFVMAWYFYKGKKD